MGANINQKQQIEEIWCWGLFSVADQYSVCESLDTSVCDWAKINCVFVHGHERTCCPVIVFNVKMFMFFYD